jgi:hypothetical protein
VFGSSHLFAFLDYFRVPYAVRLALAAGDHLLTPLSARRLHPAGQVGGSPRSLLWLGTGAGPAAWPDPCRLGRYQMRSCTFFGHIALGSVRTTLNQLGRGWHPVERAAGLVSQV